MTCRTAQLGPAFARVPSRGQRACAQDRPPRSAGSSRRAGVWVAWLAVLIAPGCAAFHPLRGVPASYLPCEYRGPSRSGKKTIDLSLLVRRPPAAYRVDSGDVLSVYIPGVLGKLSANVEEPGEEPPINTPFVEGDPPTIGYPVTVRDDGTVPLPYVAPVHVAGLTLPEVEHALRRAFRGSAKILADDPGAIDRLVVSLQRAREYRVLVVRQEAADTASASQSGTINIGNSKRGTAQLVRLRAYENDVLHALSRAEGADGLPGLDAENAIYIVRRRGRTAATGLAPPGFTVPAAPHGAPPPLPPAEGIAPAGGHSVGRAGAIVPAQYTVPPAPLSPYLEPALTPDHSAFGGYGVVPHGPWVDGGQGWPAEWGAFPTTVDNPNVTRIPVRLGDGEFPQITEQDITLYDGDIVFIESRETEVFYTGGLLGGGQYTLPRDYDLTVTKAISIAQAQNAGGSANRQLGGVSALNSDVTISPSRVIVLRTLADGRRLPIEIDLYRALRRTEEDILVQPGDHIILEYTTVEAVAAFFERHLLEGALFGVAAATLQTGGNN